MTNEIFILRDSLFEGSPSGDSFIDTYFLNGRIADQVRMMTPALSAEFTKQLEKVSSFVNLVDSINIEISGENANEVVDFELMVSDAEGYRVMWSAEMPINSGVAKIAVMPNIGEVSNDTAIASLQFKFPKYMLVSVSISFILRESLPIEPMPPDKPVDFSSSNYQAMIRQSLLHSGNLARLQRAINKAKNGEEVTLAYIGGSITQGAGAKPINTMCYAKQSCEGFIDLFAKDKSKVNYIKAGIGGTPSQLGVARYHRDILAPGNPLPDIVVIEFAVNDYDDETKGVCYESLCLMAYEGAGNPAVVLMFSVFANDENLEERLTKVGFHYGFPMVSAKQAVLPQYDSENPVLSRRHYFHDILHPSNTGHKIMADGIINLWKVADEAPLIEEGKLPETVIIGDRYRNIKAFYRSNVAEHPAVKKLDVGGFTEFDKVLQSVERNDDIFTTPQFEDNWHIVAVPNNRNRLSALTSGYDYPDCFTMIIECKDLLLLYKDTDASNFVPVEIFIDGILVRTLDPCAVGWTHCGSTFILNSDELKSRLVEIKPKISETKYCFTILGFGYTE